MAPTNCIGVNTRGRKSTLRKVLGQRQTNVENQYYIYIYIYILQVGPVTTWPEWTPFAHTFHPRQTMARV